MNYYQHHIGDFMRDTAHLSPVEECFYRRALDWYYVNEKPLPLDLDQVNRYLRAKTKTDRTAIGIVLSDFFKKTASGFVHSRCEIELEKFRCKKDASRENGKLGGRPKKNNDLQNLGVSDGLELGLNLKTQNNLNHKPLTINQEPITSNQYIYTFDLDYVNANLLKSGRKPVDQKYIDQLQPQFELYYANQPMVDNKALVKFVQWIMRNQDQPQKQQSITKTTAQILAEQRMQLDQQQGQVIDVGEPKKPLLIEEVGRA